MIRQFLLATSLLLSSQAVAQLTANPRDVVVSVEKSQRGDTANLIFNANNKTSSTQTIVLSIKGRSFERADGSIPVVRALNPGTNRLVSLINVTASPEYGYLWVAGCVDTEPDDLKYLLPVAPGKTTRIDSLKSVGEVFLGKESPVDLIAFSFPASAGDEVFAARRGTVIEVIENRSAPEGEGITYRKDNNYVIIEHEDCTRGRYEHFAENGVSASQGQEVEAGDVLGTVADGNAYINGAHLRFSVYYPDLSRKDLIAKQKDRAKTFNRRYVATKFAGVSSGAAVGEVTSVHPEEIIFQEMSKREVKKWKKAKGLK